MDQLIKKHIPKINALCEKYSVERMYLFGSALGPDFNAQSDIDFLLSFRSMPAGRQENISLKQYTDNFFGIRRDLKNLLCRNIDVVTERSLSNPYFIKDINDTKELIYEFKDKEVTI